MPSPDFDNLPGKPHYYQEAAFQSFFAEYDDRGRSQLCVMATGLGKSVTAVLIAREIVERRGGKVLVIAHLDNLINQLAEEFEAWGLPTAIEKAELKARELAALGSTKARCVIASVQTLKGRRLESWPADYFDLIIVDESHRSVSDSYRSIFDHFGKAKLLGLTATPHRTDKRNLGELYAHKCYEYLLPEAIAKQELARLTMYPIDCNVDLRDIKVKVRGGERDFDPDVISDRIGPHVIELAENAAAKLGPGQTLIFAPCRRSAQAFESAFNGLGITCASVDYKTVNRAEIIRSFKEGTMASSPEFAALANFNLLGTGFNHKSVGNIVMFRPTQSWGLLEQMLGRGTRLCDGKLECRIIDPAWIVDGSQIAKPIDLFMPPGADEETRRRARELAAKGEGIGLDEAAEQAEEEARKKREAREKAKLVREEKKVQVSLGNVRRTKFKSRKPFDLFAVRSMSGMRAPDLAPGTVRMPCTEGMSKRLKELGMDSTDQVSQKEAESILSVWTDRKEAGMSTMKQVRLLSRQGWEIDKAMDLSLSEAKRIIDPLLSKWRQKSG